MAQNKMAARRLWLSSRLQTLRISKRSFCLVTLLLVAAHSQNPAQSLIQWSRSYDGPGNGVDLSAAAAVGSNACFYITGRSSGNTTGQDFATIKYSPTGQRLLELRYNSTANSWDEATDIALDDSGYAYVTGYSFYTSSNTRTVTIKYAPDGSTRWIAQYPESGPPDAKAHKVALDDSGNVYVVGDPSLTTLKYSPHGLLLWSDTFRRDTSLVNQISSVVIDPNGDVYVGGQVSEECPEGMCIFDIVLIKYSASGQRLWVRYYDATGRSDERVHFLCLDSRANVIVSGPVNGLDGENFLTIKYLPTGDTAWVREYDGASHSYDSPRGLAVDVNDNVIIAGTTWNNNQSFNYALVKYDSAGITLWDAEYDGPNHTRDFVGGLCIDRHGDIYLTGNSAYWYDSSLCSTVKFSSLGVMAWSASYKDSIYDGGNFVMLDSSGNVYVGGDCAGRVNGWNYLVLKYCQEQLAIPETNHNTDLATWRLYQNYPNPFNPTTTITYTLSSQERDGVRSQHVTLRVFDLLGREVTTLVNEEKPPGTYHVQWDGNSHPSGIYFYRLTTSSLSKTMKAILIK